jgi:predicted RNA-binding protein with PUA-like domain
MSLELLFDNKLPERQAGFRASPGSSSCYDCQAMAARDDMMAVTATCETTRWLSNDIMTVTGQAAPASVTLSYLNADNEHYVKLISVTASDARLGVLS